MKPLQLFSFLLLGFSMSIGIHAHTDSSNSGNSHDGHTADMRVTTVKTPVDGGIREDIPAKYLERYEKWKAEFVSTDFGRAQWESYTTNKQFILTIVVTSKKGKGAGTDKYLWDESGAFVGATIAVLQCHACMFFICI